MLKQNECNIQMVKSMVIASCVLQHLCVMNSDEYREEWSVTGLNQPDRALPSTVAAEGLDAQTGLMKMLNTW